jgi:hypothetical protein
LVLKVTLTPLLVLTVSLVGRRWGPAVSGWLVGLPFTSGPVVLLLALDHGAVFAAAAAQGLLAGAISEVAYCLAYSWLARRWGWPRTFLASCGVFAAATLALQRITPPLAPLIAGVLAALLLSLLAFPSDAAKHGETKRVESPPWEIPARMLLATGLVVLLTGLATAIGPRLSGLLAPFPVYGTILAIFTQRFAGPTAAARLLRGLVLGMFAFVSFAFVLAALLVRLGIAPAFLIACLAALLVQGATYYVLPHQTAAEAEPSLLEQ